MATSEELKTIAEVHNDIQKIVNGEGEAQEIEDKITDYVNEKKVKITILKRGVK